MVEGAPLLREYRLKRLIEGSNPSLSAKKSPPAWGLFFALKGVVQVASEFSSRVIIFAA